MGIRRELSSQGWQTFEVVQQDSDGIHTITPVSTALALGGIIPPQPITKMRIVQMIGWPEAKWRLKDDIGCPLIVKKDSWIWLLKCKPTCWRLYFYVYEKQQFIVYVHAVCKKQNAEGASDARTARAIAEGIRPGGSRIQAFEFPAR